jgi:hypothetical protein
MKGFHFYDRNTRRKDGYLLSPCGLRLKLSLILINPNPKLTLTLILKKNTVWFERRVHKTRQELGRTCTAGSIFRSYTPLMFAIVRPHPQRRNFAPARPVLHGKIGDRQWAKGLGTLLSCIVNSDFRPASGFAEGKDRCCLVSRGKR